MVVRRMLPARFGCSTSHWGRYRAGVFLVPEQGYVNPFLTKDGKRTASRSAERTPGGRLEVLIAIDGGEIRGALQDGDGVPMPNRNVHLREDPPRFDCFKIAPRPGRAATAFRRSAPESTGCLR
jgi:hypothetical protein